MEWIQPNQLGDQDCDQSQLARKALLAGLNKSLPPIKFAYENLTIENHCYLQKYPEILVSLSHTKSYAVAAWLKKGEMISIGVDIEKASRVFNPKIEKFFVNSSDQWPPLLELWCLKEASFKALAPYYSPQAKILLLKHIWIKDKTFGLVGLKNPLGHCQLTHESFNGENFYLARASLYKSSLQHL